MRPAVSAPRAEILIADCGTEAGEGHTYPFFLRIDVTRNTDGVPKIWHRKRRAYSLLLPVLTISPTAFPVTFGEYEEDDWDGTPPDFVRDPVVLRGFDGYDMTPEKAAYWLYQQDRSAVRIETVRILPYSEIRNYEAGVALAAEALTCQSGTTWMEWR